MIGFKLFNTSCRARKTMCIEIDLYELKNNVASHFHFIYLLRLTLPYLLMKKRNKIFLFSL